MRSFSFLTRIPFPLGACALVLASGAAFGDDPPPSLSTVRVPIPPNIGIFVKNQTAAIELGKALFWDEQVGGDGRISCATCHFSAGADRRVTNTMHPGPDGIFDGVPAPGGTLTASHFPIAGDNIVGSQGIVGATFNSLDSNPANAADNCTPNPDGVFFPQRRVTGRNTPTTIMAVFYRDNFWDGRAKRDFNGVTPLGISDPSAPKIFVNNGSGLQAQTVRIAPASAASQSVGPPNNDVEMSCAGRTFPLLGKKLLARTPLGLQVVAPTDSVLGSLSLFPSNGLNKTYPQMIAAAFQDNLHNSTQLTPSGATQMEANFSLFWGLSILLYNSTLIPDETPFDQFREGNNAALTANQQLGMDVFLNKGLCSACHRGPEFTAAAIRSHSGGHAFANIGVTPTAADVGRQPENQGKFKTPTLRNVELTGPYFHNGRYLTLRQVVDFYNRGGDVANANLHSQIRPLGLTVTERDALVDFLLALTDERVRFERAPFDRPSLAPPNGPVLQAVGAGGSVNPIPRFLDADPFLP